MTHNDNWPQLIAHYRARHGLTQTEFAENLKVTQQTVSRWESGKQTPDPEAQQLLRSVIGLTALSTKAAWQQRVALSGGIEALFEKGWKCLAGSDRLQAATGLSPERLAEKSLADLPTEKNYASLLDRTPFFDGGVRVLKARAEVKTQNGPLLHNIDLWPVLTSGDEIVAHAIAHPVEAPHSGGNSHDVRLFDIQAVMADGNVLKLDDDGSS